MVVIWVICVVVRVSTLMMVIARASWTILVLVDDTVPSVKSAWQAARYVVKVTTVKLLDCVPFSAYTEGVRQ